MNVLVLSSRFPWPAYTGDRLRATIWLSALESEGNVTLVSPAGNVPANAPRFRFYPAARSLTRVAAGALRVAGGRPVQSLLAAPYDWAGAIERARKVEGEFDAAIVLLSRLDPFVRELLPPYRVLDAIDSLSRSMVERAREGPWLEKWFWLAEGRRMARLESDAAHVYDRVVVVNEDESRELHAVAVSNGIALGSLPHTPRPFDFGFWGHLHYFANNDAVTWLLDEIWPLIRAQRPNATLLIGGAAAPPRVRAAHGRDGITVESPVADMAAAARRIRVALFPMRYGTGQSNKVLEAAEAGCAIAGTPQAMRGFAPLEAHTVIASSASEIAQTATALANDESRRATMAASLRSMVGSLYAREETLERLAEIIRRREAAA